jgi:predicted transcriptional regulator
MSATSGNLRVRSTATANTPELDPLTVLSAFADPVRWQIIGLLAPGRSLSGTEIAAELGRSPDAVNKHLRVLRDAGVVLCSPGADRRYFAYQIAATVRATAGILDYGCCTLRLDNAKPDDMAKD